MKKHFPEWVLACQTQAGGPLLPIPLVVSLLGGREGSFTARLLPWWSLDSSLGEIQSSLPSFSLSFSLLILTDGLLLGWVCFLLLIERLLWSTSYSSIPLSEKMSQKGFHTPLILTDGPSPAGWEKRKEDERCETFRKAQISPHFKFSAPPNIRHTNDAYL